MRIHFQSWAQLTHIHFQSLTQLTRIHLESWAQLTQIHFQSWAQLTGACYDFQSWAQLMCIHFQCWAQLSLTADKRVVREPAKVHAYEKGIAISPPQIYEAFPTGLRSQSWSRSRPFWVIWSRSREFATAPAPDQA